MPCFDKHERERFESRRLHERDGVAQQVSLAAPFRTEEPPSEASLGPPTLTLRNAQALESPFDAPPAVAAE